MKQLTDFYSFQKNKINGNWDVDCMFEIYNKVPGSYTFNFMFWTGNGIKKYNNIYNYYANLFLWKD